MSIRSGFSLAYQPHHGQSISGARALPPDALDGVIQPSNGIGTRILYDIPVPYNPEFGRGLNASGGVQSRPGEPPIRITGFVVNPTIKTQYTESWFLNGQRRLGAALGRRGRLRRHAGRQPRAHRRREPLQRRPARRPRGSAQPELRRAALRDQRRVVDLPRGHRRDPPRVRARASRCRPTTAGRAGSTRRRTRRPASSRTTPSPARARRTSPACAASARRRCSTCRTASPRRWSTRRRCSTSAPTCSAGSLQHWQVSAVVTAQSGRPFSVWNGAAFSAGGDYNADGGGGAVGGGFYDRPDAPDAGSLDASFGQDDFLNGLFAASAFPKPAPAPTARSAATPSAARATPTLDLSLTRTIRPRRPAPGAAAPRRLQCAEHAEPVPAERRPVGVELRQVDAGLRRPRRAGRREGPVLSSRLELLGDHVLSRSSPRA